MLNENGRCIDMSNCIRLRKPDKPFAAMLFRQDIWDRVMASDGRSNDDKTDTLRWIDWFVCDGGQINRGNKPDRILFYMRLCTTREMNIYVHGIKELGGWVIDFKVGNEYDDYRSTYTWEYRPY
jgi:hypothetical protein